ncbi:MAG TPA: hypothetical protein VFH92_09195 [Phenylobacterium sp.]|nr:hypothetical protein [Phenylobacterium sp.]
MPQVTYTVDKIDGVWTVGLGDRRFGPYSTLETAVAAASKAAHKAEAQGYEVFVIIDAPDEPVSADEPAAQDAA